MRWTRDEKVYLCGMHYIGGLTLEEIAKDLKRNEDTVRSGKAKVMKWKPRSICRGTGLLCRRLIC